MRVNSESAKIFEALAILSGFLVEFNKAHPNSTALVTS